MTLQSKNRSWWFELIHGTSVIFRRETKIGYKDARL